MIGFQQPNVDCYYADAQRHGKFSQNPRNMQRFRCFYGAMGGGAVSGPPPPTLKQAFRLRAAACAPHTAHYVIARSGQRPRRGNLIPVDKVGRW